MSISVRELTCGGVSVLLPRSYGGALKDGVCSAFLCPQLESASSFCFVCLGVLCVLFSFLSFISSHRNANRSKANSQSAGWRSASSVARFLE